MRHNFVHKFPTFQLNVTLHNGLNGFVLIRSARVGSVCRPIVSSNILMYPACNKSKVLKGIPIFLLLKGGKLTLKSTEKLKKQQSFAIVSPNFILKLIKQRKTILKTYFNFLPLLLV